MAVVPLEFVLLYWQCINTLVCVCACVRETANFPLYLPIDVKEIIYTFSAAVKNLSIGICSDSVYVYIDQLFEMLHADDSL